MKGSQRRRGATTTSRPRGGAPSTARHAASAPGDSTRSGARAVLGLAASALAMAIGMRTAFVQADNYALAAQMDGLQRDMEWNERRATELRAAAVRFEFDVEAFENRQRFEDSAETTQR
ncbi:MAG: hypothetical protein R3F49_03250 [Planctomycetota bacterium]